MMDGISFLILYLLNLNSSLLKLTINTYSEVIVDKNNLI